MSFQNTTAIPATSSAEPSYFFCQGVRTNGKPCKSEISRRRRVRHKVRYCIYHEEQAEGGGNSNNNDDVDSSSDAAAATVPCTRCGPSYEAREGDLAEAHVANQKLADETDTVKAQHQEIEQELAATNEQCDQLVEELGQAREDNQKLRTLVLEMCRANGETAALNQQQKNRHRLDEQRHQAWHAAAEEKMKNEHAEAEKKLTDEFAEAEKKLKGQHAEAEKKLKDQHAEAEKKLRDQHADELSALRQERDALRAENAMRRDAYEKLEQTNHRLALDLTNAESTATQLREDAATAKLEAETSGGRADGLATEVDRVRAQKERLAFQLALANCRMLTVTTSDLHNALGGDNEVLAASQLGAAAPQAKAQDDDGNHRAEALTADPEASRNVAHSVTSELPSNQDVAASAADDDNNNNDDGVGDYDDADDDAGTAGFASADATTALGNSISGAALVLAGVLGLSWALGG